MKKLILSVAILAVAASCSKNEVVDISQTSATSISFSTLNDRVVSKAANDANENYHVLANVAEATAWFINEEIGGGNDTYTDGTIISGNTYFYPSDEKNVIFYAYAPYGANTSDTAPDVTTPTFSYTVPGNVDLTVAEPQTQNADGVVLPFSHVLSKVTFVVALDESLKSGYEIDDTDMKAELTVASSVGTVSLSDKSIISTGTGNDASATYSLDNTLSYMVMPQSITTAETPTHVVSIKGLVINNISTGGTQFSGKLADIDLYSTFASVPTFEAGIHYVYTIIISSLSTGNVDYDKEDGDETTDSNEDGYNDTEEELFTGEITFSSTIADWTTNSTSIVEYDATAEDANMATALTTALGIVNEAAASSSQTKFYINATAITISSSNSTTTVTTELTTCNFKNGDTITFTFNSASVEGDLSTFAGNFTITESDSNDDLTFTAAADTTNKTITFTVTDNSGV